MAIGEYCAGRGANRAIAGIANRQKVKRLLRKDKAYINQIFLGKAKAKELHVDEFLLNQVFQNSKFLCPGMELPEQLQSELAQQYLRFYTSQANGTSLPETAEEVVNKLVLCVNFHNHLVHQLFLSDADKLVVKEISDKLDALGYSGAILNENGDYLSQNAELEYAHLQLNSIIHTLRMDAKFYRLIVLIGMIGVLLLVPVTVFLLSMFKYEITPTLLMTMYPVLFALIALFILTLFNLSKVARCEKTITQCSSQLWELNFWIYKKNLQHDMARDKINLPTDSNT